MRARRSAIRRSARSNGSTTKEIITSNQHTTPTYLHDNLSLRPLYFEVPQQETEPLFIGRTWILKEIGNTFSTTDTSGILINGKLGTGKTAIILQLVEYSCFGRRKEMDMSFEQDNIYGQNDRIRGLASTVVAYHFCQADNNSTCSVPDFVHSLAAQLCQAPQLVDYRNYLANEPHLQNILTVKECIADPERAMKMGILEPLNNLRKAGHLRGISKYCMILVDAVCEAEYHRPDYGDTIGTFLAKMVIYFPSWLRVLATVRSEMSEYVKAMPYTRISLDAWNTNESLQKDLNDYIAFRTNHSPQIQHNISCSGRETSSSVGKFSQHLVNLARGSYLFTKLTLDLLERGHLVIKSTSYKVLPINLAQIYLLHFNLKFPTETAFNKVATMLSVCLATLAPLTLPDIFYTLNALNVNEPLEWDEFLQNFNMLSGFLVKRSDLTYMFFHPSFREWLIRRDEGESAKFLCDMRKGNAAIAFRLSRSAAPINAEQTLELGHHILKANLYRNMPILQTPRDLQSFWVEAVTENASDALCTLRNCYNPNVKVSRLLLLAGASPDARTEYFGNATILCIASHEGIIPMVKCLLEFGADVELTNSQGCTPLILAAAKGNWEVVRLLVAAGSALGHTDIGHQCALVHAARAGKTEVVKYLLGCDWTCRKDESNDMPLDEAIHQALIVASSEGKTGIVEILLDNYEEIEINRADKLTGETALTIAATKGCFETVVLLLARGAGVDIANAKSMSALLLSVKGNYYSIVERLLLNKADLEQMDNNNKTALMIAAEEGNVDILELLYNAGEL